MNPGKVVDPYRLDENLRLVPPTTHPGHRPFPGSPPTRATSPRRPCAVWEWARAARPTVR
jgi:hypothetical protein